MGIGGAFIFPTTLSILTNVFRAEERAKAIGIWAGVSGLGIAIGPLVGGLLLEHFWWGSVFLVNVPICAIAIVLGRFFVPDTRATRPTGRLDPLGAVLSIVGLVGLLYAIIEGPDRLGRAGGDAGFVVGVVLVALFVWWERTPTIPCWTCGSSRTPASRPPRHDHPDLLRPVRLHLPADPVLPVRARLFAAQSRHVIAPVAVGIMVCAPQAPSSSAVRHQAGRRRPACCSSPGPWRCYSSNTIMSSVLAGGLRPARVRAAAWASPWRRPPSRSWVRSRRARPE